MATHSSILALKVLRTEEPYSPWSPEELDMTEQQTHTHTRMFYHGIIHGVALDFPLPVLIFLF